MAKKIIKDFSKYYKSLPLQDRNRIRDKFLERTGLAYPSWYSKLASGHFSKLEISLLEDLCNIDINEPKIL